MPDHPDVSIIIVSYNVSSLLDVCLATIKKYTKSVSYEVIVVDSASEDDSVEMVKSKHADVTLIASPDNLGFSKGNNVGLAAAKGKDILYLNPDIELVEDAIGPMHQALSNEKVGIVGCRLLNTDKSLQSTIGSYTSLQTVVDEFILRKKKEEIRIAHPDQPTVVPVLLGACLLVRGNLARKLGGFDERYYMYNEETDLCLAAKEAGFDTLYYPAVAMIHHGSKSSGRNEASRQRSLHITRVSILTFLKKHYGWFTQFIGKLIIGIVLVVQWLAYLPRLLSSQREGAKLRLRYYGYTLLWIITGRRAGF